MSGDGGVNEFAAESPWARKHALLVGAGESRIADNIRNQDRREFAPLPLFLHQVSLSLRSLARSYHNAREA